MVVDEPGSLTAVAPQTTEADAATMRITIQAALIALAPRERELIACPRRKRIQRGHAAAPDDHQAPGGLP
jgi:hypothetical protein